MLENTTHDLKCRDLDEAKVVNGSTRERNNQCLQGGAKLVCCLEEHGLQLALLDQARDELYYCMRRGRRKSGKLREE